MRPVSGDLAFPFGRLNARQHCGFITGDDSVTAVISVFAGDGLYSTVADMQRWDSAVEHSRQIPATLTPPDARASRRLPASISAPMASI